MSIEWDSLILGGNELKTVGAATENACRANSVQTHGTNSIGVYHITKLVSSSIIRKHFSQS